MILSSKVVNRIALLLVVGIAAVGCSSSRTEVVKPAQPEFVVRNVPGVVEYIWEEPMVDVIDVPPGLDPEGHYYRPGHQEVVEIRQGRWQYYRRPSR
jgi:hypothetical protein